MSGTPRLRSSFPSTPGSADGTPTRAQPSHNGSRVTSPLQNLPATSEKSPASTPVIPFELIDAPSQRMYTLAIYGLLIVWRLYDWWTLVEADTSSMGLFLKWSCVDVAFLFGVPWMRIPWLEWSDPTTLTACVAHVSMNAMLMFRIPLPLEGWLLFVIKTVFDTEMSVSENKVRPASILHNSSLIMGKQIINILPEGSVTMNPEQLSFCIDSAHPLANIPLFFNQTKPKNVELLRIDFDSNINETLVLSQREIKNIRKTHDDTLLTLNYAAKKPGLYRLSKVVDRTKLEVQRRMSDTLVVNCPKAVIKSSGSDRCLGDLSDLTMEIEGTPPLKVVYSRTANSDQSVHHFQSIQPENFASPLVGTPSKAIVAPGSQDVSWGGSQRISVPLNESMTPAGKWLYSIDEIHDAAGNVANFSTSGDDGEHLYPKGAHLEQAFTVHERPAAQLYGCDLRSPMMVASGKARSFPVSYLPMGVRSNQRAEDSAHTIIWKFSPLDTLKDGDHSSEAVLREYEAKDAHDFPNIKESGLYTLVGVKSRHCNGVVKEPSSCLLLNPPEPQLLISSENIYDKCAGNSIGLTVDLDLIGTPPFVVKYLETGKDGKREKQVQVPGSRHQLELKPTSAGHFKYQFVSVDDDVYKGHRLVGEGLTLEQDVKPPASAYLRNPSMTHDTCIEEPVEMTVDFSGEAPFAFEYELIHDGKREKEKVSNIVSNRYTIRTKPLLKGGEYTLALKSVTDKTGCKIFLNSEAEFTVRRQRPKAAFGYIDGKHKTVQVEGSGVALPVRLTGRSPWTLKYRNLNDTSGRIQEKTARSPNDHIKVDQKGTYEILEVSDDQCPGTVDSLASVFAVDWFPRPHIRLADTAVLIPHGKKFTKREVCEGDIDAIELNLIGSSPYNVKYQVKHKPIHGSTSPITKSFEAALGSATVTMDTAKPGFYEYIFSELSDALYDHDGKKFTPLAVEQKVNRKPSATFSKPGQAYKYCKEDLGTEVIPIKLEGVPPFSLEVDIKHESHARPETIKIANIESNTYDLRIPKQNRSLGKHQVSVRKVRDSKGCQQKTEYGGPHVSIQVYDSPTIYPLETRSDYCVGERISYTLSGTQPFEIFYIFNNAPRKAKTASTTFKRIAELPGNFTITGVSDKSSECKATTSIQKIIHEMPSVKISKGRQVEVDIHEGGEAEILFEFWGTPPFEFTYTRSTNAKRGQKSTILETRHEMSDEHSMAIRSSQEGTYEVVAIKDKYCSFSTQRVEESKQRLLQF